MTGWTLIIVLAFGLLGIVLFGLLWCALAISANVRDKGSE